MSAATRRQQLETLREKYYAELVADDLRPDISLDGESTDRQRRREWLLKALGDIDMALGKLRKPYQKRTYIQNL